MAELTAKGRKKIKDANFVYPPTKVNPEGKYPIHDRAHAANALARVAQFGTPAEKAKVKAAVCRKYPDMPICQKAKGKK